MSAPGESPALLKDALRRLQAGEATEAAAICRAVLRAQPHEPDAMFLLAVTAQLGGAHEEAQDLLARAIVQRPNAASYHLRRGNSLRELNRQDEAIAAYDAALRLSPTLADAHHQRGNALKQLRRYREAKASLTEATRLAAQDAAAWLNRGVAHLELRELDEAVGCFRTASRLEPGRPEAHNILGVALNEKGLPSEAQLALQEALRVKPGYAAALNNLGRTYRLQGRMPEAADSFRAALAHAADPEVHSNLVYALNFIPGLDPADIFAEHKRWNELHAQPLARPPTQAPLQRDSNRRLRVGFVSPDLSCHAVAYFFEPVLEYCDREQFELVCYSDARVPDHVTERLRRRADRWRDIAGLSDERVATLVGQDQVDILIDLAGHTAGNRLRLFARRPAPVQATWIGYPNTTGLTAIDYRITDHVSDPVGQTEQWHAERLVRLPETFLCYRPPEYSPPVNSLPASRNDGAVTFGCFNHIAKLTPPTIALWSQLLMRDRRARLYLKSHGLNDRDTLARLSAEFTRFGVDPARLEFDGRVLSVAEHLALYHRVDVALDPFPYNGTTTTCEALWMGVPVVTLTGRTHVARVGASLLTHLGNPEWVATSAEDYLAACLRLVSDLGALAETRQHLRERLQASPICDAPRFIRGLEDAFRTMWQQSSLGLSGRAVPPAVSG